MKEQIDRLLGLDKNKNKNRVQPNKIDANMTYYQIQQFRNGLNVYRATV